MRAIMAAMKILLCLIFFICCFPIFVEENVPPTKRISTYENTTVQMNLDDFQIYFQSWFGFFCCGFFAVMICALFLFISFQLKDIQKIDNDCDHLVSVAQRTNEKAEAVLEFYKEMEEVFTSLEARSNSLRHACDLEKETGFDMHLALSLTVEIDQMKGKWQRQQNVFARYGLELEGATHTRESIAAELSVAGAFVGSQIKRIKQDIAEDTLSLRDVQRDARILKVYFDK